MSDDSTDWIGDRDRNRFGIFTVPSSADYELSPSLVEVYDIHLEDENVIVSINMSAPEQPLLYVSETDVAEGAGANDNGSIEPGEQVEWSITLSNLGVQEATAAYAMLTYSGENDWVDIVQDEIEFPDIPGAENRPSNEPFVIAISEDAPLRSTLEFTLTAHSNDSLEFSYDINFALIPSHEWFKYQNNPVLGGEADAWDEGILSPAVVIEEDMLKCWYLGISDEGDGEGPPSGDIGYAFSEDGGLTWQQDDEPILTIDEVEWAGAGFGGIAVMPGPEGDYIMTFLASTDEEGMNNSIGIAGSRNGRDWIVAESPIVEPDGRFFMSFFPTQLSLAPYPPDAIVCTFSGIVGQAIVLGNAVSENGQDWNIDFDLTIPPTGNMERFDAFALFAPDVTLDGQNEAFRVFYSGIGADEVLRLGLVNVDPGGLSYHDGVETGGSVLEPDEDDWDGVDLIFGGRYFVWNGEPRLLYVGINDDEESGGIAVGLASSLQFDEQSVPLFGRKSGLPTSIELESIYPNPFNSTTTITYRLAAPGSVTVTIHDIAGREVSRLLNEAAQTTGQHQAVWDGTNSKNTPVTSGFYIATVKSDEATVKAKLLLIR